ncbi:MAG TPA: hypothetical protein PK297_12285 [Spirochaetota bacterium]|nr:hypothetical protein [Spirochaetota bacterium]
MPGTHLPMITIIKTKSIDCRLNGVPQSRQCTRIGKYATTDKLKTEPASFNFKRIEDIVVASLATVHPSASKPKIGPFIRKINPFGFGNEVVG